MKQWDNLEWPWIEGAYDLNEGIQKWAESCGLIFMQFTGLLDKNGKEIYEGDVVKIDFTGMKNGEKKWSENFEVKWTGERYEAGNWSLFDHCKYTRVEVIGNIYENPELLLEVK